MIVFLSIFWIAIFPFFGKIRCPNEVPGKNNFHTFASILEVKRHFLTLPLFLSIFLAKMLKKCWNSMPINWKAHRMESKFDSQLYARLTDLPKGLTQHYLTKPPHERVQHPTFTAWAFSRSLLKIRFNLHAKNDSSLNHGIISLSSIHTALRASLLRPIHTTETLNYSFPDEWPCLRIVLICTLVLINS